MTARAAFLPGKQPVNPGAQGSGGARLIGLDPAKVSLDWIGMKVKARYLRNAKLKPTDVYFVPMGNAEE